MGINRDAAALELAPEDLGRRLVGVPGDDHASNIQAVLGQVVDELHGIDVIGDPEVGPDFLPLDIAGENAEKDVGPVPELLEQAHLDVRIESRQNPRGVHVEENFSAELKIQLIAEPVDPFEDLGFLLGKVQFAVESYRGRHRVLLISRGGKAAVLYRTSRVRCQSDNTNPHPG